MRGGIRRIEGEEPTRVQRILVVGSRAGDRVDEVSATLNQIIEARGLTGQVRAEFVRDESFLDMAIAGERNGNPNPAAYVLAGQEFRTYMNGGGMTLPMEALLPRLESTCDRFGAKVIRFAVLPGSDVPVLRDEEINGGIERLLRLNRG